MSYSVEALYTGNGATTQFGIDFEYQEEAHVHVTVNGVVVPFSFLAPSIILITPAPVLGAVVRIWRETPIDALNHKFQLGAPFLPAYIDANNAQLLFSAQESRAIAAGAEATAGGIAATAQEALDNANLALETVEAAGVAAFNGRTGLVTPQAGDYNATQITRGASTVAAAITALETGKQAVTAELTAFLGLPSAANKLPYYTGPNTFGVTDLTTFARHLLSRVDASAARNALQLSTGATATLTQHLGDMTLGRIPKNGDRQMCTAWVNFLGTGTVGVRDSFNVSSIVDLGAGHYRINFAAPMLNSTYAISGFATYSVNTAPAGLVSFGNNYAPTLGYVEIKTANSTTGIALDSAHVNVLIFGGRW